MQQSWDGALCSAYPQSSSLDDPSFHGYYFQIGHFLTPDRKPYDTRKGAFGHPYPLDPYGARLLKAFVSAPDRGRHFGAWEIVGRYSHVDLNDGPVQGGAMTDVGGGLNWYLDEFRRIELNYIHSRLDSDESADILLLRFQLEF